MFSSLQHWHGVFQKHTNYDDGPAFVTQCPLIPNESFTYDFSVPDQAVFSLVRVERVDKPQLLRLFRGHYGITATTRPNTVMGCVVL